ncbi:MAG: hypothetical protein ACI38Z_04870 [Parafannyhessea sp.]
MEESGLVVSQVADFKNGRVTAFMTWPGKDARGGPSRAPVQGDADRA